VTLLSARHPLSSARAQLRVLEERPGVHPRFQAMLAQAGHDTLRAAGITTLQINVGKLCNQTCSHCHVDAGPDRKEIMTRETAELCIDVLRGCGIPIVDITGGAPELNPNFRWLVEQARALSKHVMDRCNLTVIVLPSQAGLADFLAEHQVEIVASLPYFLAERTDAQRGDGVFARSIQALQILNRHGYGDPASGLRLNLVYNPGGAFLPPSQRGIEADFRRELHRRHGVIFNSLYTITNMPISRFLDFLLRTSNYERYMEKLVNAFNPAAIGGLMCRSTLSVGWDGTLYDCDFNQMLELPVDHGAPRHIRDFTEPALAGRRIVTGEHCFGCTAGSGSSCGGAIDKTV
jgi:radical SAM/Cys-rich protein